MSWPTVTTNKYTARSNIALDIYIPSNCVVELWKVLLNFILFIEKYLLYTNGKRP